MRTVLRSICICAAFVGVGALAIARDGRHVGLDPEAIGKPPVTSWPTFNGDYTGQRYSTLTQIGPGNVDRLAERWVFKISDIGAQRGAPEARGTLQGAPDTFTATASPSTSGQYSY